MKQLSFRSIISALCAGACLAACGGGPTGTAPPAVPSASPSQGSGGQAQVEWIMKWASPSRASKTMSKRHLYYLAPTARSASIAVITAPGVKTGLPIEYLNSPSTTLTFAAPTGLDTFQIKTYDEQNGLGNVLSEANLTQKVVNGSANVVTSILNGVIASLQVSISGSVNAGTPFSGPLTVSALDADGNVIVGPGDYNTPIHLTSSSTHVALSQNLIQVPGGTPTLSYEGSPLWSASITATADGASSATFTFAPTPTIYEYSIPTGTSEPWDITLGPDGNMWFTERAGNNIGTVTNSGAITEFPVTSSGAGPLGITSGAGKIWFTENSASNIGSITTSGVVSEYPTNKHPDGPWGILYASDGSLWSAGSSGNDIEYAQVASLNFQSVALPNSNSFPEHLALGSDNLAYFTEQNGSRIGRLNFDNSISEVALSSGAKPIGITKGPDGNLWFTESLLSKIGVLGATCFCVVSEYPTATRRAVPWEIAAGGDGALWFTENGQNNIGRITTTGTVTEFAIPTAAASPVGIAVGSDGSIWFAEFTANNIGRLVY